MKRLHQILIGGAGVLAVAVGTAVVAAPRDGMGDCGMGGGMGPGMMQGGHGGHAGHGDMAAMADKRLAEFKTELKISAQQEPAWQAFASQAAEQAKAMQARHQQAMQAHEQAGAAKLPAPERMAQHLDQMKQHLASMEGMQGAVKNLYAALSPEQRTVADKHFEHMQRGRMGQRMHRG
jgi:hypothetical protein